MEVEVQGRLSRSFFTRDGITVAKELLGKVLVHETEVGTIRGVITEVESYMGVEDKGSHTYGGRRTDRTEPMFHVGGTSYVYLIYGMYSCMNIAAAVEDVPQAVLIRSVVPADEASRERMLELRMRKQRQKKQVSQIPASVEKHLADGPGKLCIAMDITRADNDVDLVESKTFYVTEGIAIDSSQIQAGKRIGIDYAEEAADYLWRFYIKEETL
ncbi:MAG: DNA-3-methyladenine glycosylase [Acetatifactor sp.]|nr:DNA-3-methyladenine glycosylase [Acetatifactor sp.]